MWNLCEIYDMLCFLSRLETSETSNDQCVSELAWENGFLCGHRSAFKNGSISRKEESIVQARLKDSNVVILADLYLGLGGTQHLPSGKLT